MCIRDSPKPDKCNGVMGEQRALPSMVNNFQGRYIMLNPWEGKMSCENPVRGRWGGPPAGETTETATASQDPLVKRDGVELEKQVKTLDFLPRRLADAVGERGGEDDGAKEPGTEGSGAEAKPVEESGASPAPKVKPTQTGCAQAGAGAPSGGAPYPAGLLGLLGLVGWRRRRRRRS